MALAICERAGMPCAALVAGHARGPLRASAARLRWANSRGLLGARPASLDLLRSRAAGSDSGAENGALVSTDKKPSAPPSAPAASTTSSGSSSSYSTSADYAPEFFLSDPGLQSLTFGALSVTSALLAGACLAAPEAVLSAALPRLEPTALDPVFVRVTGATLLLSAVVEYCLKAAVDGKRIQSLTYQRLMAGCMIKSFLYVVMLAAHWETFPSWNIMLLLAYPVLALGATTAQALVITNTSGKGFVFPSPEFGMPKTPTSWFYSVCVLLYMATALACFAPESMFMGSYSKDTSLIKSIWAPGFLLAAVASYVLKDGADRGRLGASTFKNLNLGIAGLEIAYAGVFIACMASGLAAEDDITLPNLFGSLGISSFCIYTYFTAKK